MKLCACSYEHHRWSALSFGSRYSTAATPSPLMARIVPMFSGSVSVAHLSPLRGDLVSHPLLPAVGGGPMRARPQHSLLGNQQQERLAALIVCTPSAANIGLTPR